MTGDSEAGSTTTAVPSDRETAATATTVRGDGDASQPPSASTSARGAPSVAVGDVLGGRYRVLSTIGHGGMGVVYAAEHVSIGKTVAIKVLGPDLSHRPGVVERFMQEARAASLIGHPHIVDITDFGFVRDGEPFFVMEHLEGQTLGGVIKDRGRLRWPSVRKIMGQLCTALQAAHDKGVVHRDIKPDNIILIEHGADPEFVKVLDFGIAKITADRDKNLTSTGTVMGTAAYMSPEQAQSLPIDARTDVYAAGVIAYEMLTGRVPFDAGGFVGVLTKHVSERVPSMRKRAPEARISGALERVVGRALSKDRAQRYPSAKAFGDALDALGDRGGRSLAGPWPRMVAVAAASVAGAVWLAGGFTPSTPEVAASAAPSPTPAADTPPPQPPQAAADASAGSTSGGAEPAAAGATTAPSVPAIQLPRVEELGDPGRGDTGSLPAPPRGSATGGPSLPSLADLDPPATATGDIDEGESGSGSTGEGTDGSSGATSPAGTTSG